MWRDFKIDTVNLGKALINIGMFFQKLQKSPFLVKLNLSFRFTIEETCFISFKDLSCILISKRIFKQCLKFHVFSILATQLTGF